MTCYCVLHVTVPGAWWRQNDEYLPTAAISGQTRVVTPPPLRQPVTTPPPPAWPAVHAALSRDRYVLNQCWITVGPASATLVQHKYNIGWMSRVCGQYSLRILDRNHLVAGENSWHHSILGSRHTPPLLSNIPSLVLPFNWPDYSRYVLMASRVYCGSVSGDDWAASSSH